jgi:hypothetical protein
VVSETWAEGSQSDLLAAYVLNMRGTDIPYNPLFHAYLYVGLDSATLFLESSKVDEEIEAYLQSIRVERKPYADIWTFLRKREWGEGKVGLIHSKDNGKDSHRVI